MEKEEYERPDSSQLLRRLQFEEEEKLKKSRGKLKIFERPDSSQLLRRLQFEEEEKLKKSRGKLKIFLGYAAGSGKTYAMLKAAHEAKKHHIDVVAGYVEPHARPDTQALVKGLETPY